MSVVDSTSISSYTDDLFFLIVIQRFHKWVFHDHLFDNLEVAVK